MKIYTRTGDDGFTTLGDHRRVRKCDPPLAALGALEELSAHIGASLAAAQDEVHSTIREALAPLGAELLAMGALLGGPGTDKSARVDLDERAVSRMEQQIDAAWSITANSSSSSRWASTHSTASSRSASSRARRMS